MTKREAVRVLFMCPIYWKMTTKQRLKCVKEFCATWENVSAIKRK
ncbi:MAG: hypothetical protein ABFQ53_00730 [Patescibacteria group bacterium]